MFFRVNIRAWISGPNGLGDPAFWMTVAQWFFGKGLRHQPNPVLRAMSDSIAQSMRNAVPRPTRPRARDRRVPKKYE